VSDGDDAGPGADDTTEDTGTSVETHTVRLELADEPGELLRALGPIAEGDGNLLSVVHERGDRTPRGRVPVTVEFHCPPSRLSSIVESLDGAGVTVAQVDHESYTERLTVLLVGHVVESDLSEMLTRVEESPAASVVDLSLSAPEGTDEVSAARLVLGVTDGDTGAALSAVRSAADRKGLRLLTPVETALDSDHESAESDGTGEEGTSHVTPATTGDADGGLRLAVLGAGTVGRAVCRAAPERGHRVVAVADSTGARVDPEGIDVGATLRRKADRGSVGGEAPTDALEAPYDVLVEATPTTLGDAEPGFGHAVRALERDRSVVLANKGPVV